MLLCALEKMSVVTFTLVSCVVTSSVFCLLGCNRNLHGCCLNKVTERQHKILCLQSRSDKTNNSTPEEATSEESSTPLNIIPGLQFRKSLLLQLDKSMWAD